MATIQREQRRILKNEPEYNIENFLYYQVFEWNGNKYEEIDFYENYDYNTSYKDVSEMNISFKSSESGQVEFSFPFTLENQVGTQIGNYFYQKDLKSNYIIIQIADDIYSCRSSETEYSEDNKGIIKITAFDTTEILDSFIGVANGFRIIESNNKDKGYVPKISYINKSLKYILTQTIKYSLFDKRKLVVPKTTINPNKLPKDTENQSLGFSGVFDYQAEEEIVTIELEPQTITQITQHINSKYNTYVKIKGRINSEGLIDLFVPPQAKYSGQILKYSSRETTNEYNNEYVNNIVAISPDTRYYRRVTDKRVFMPIIVEEYLSSDKFSTEDDGLIQETEYELEKRRNFPQTTTYIIDDVSDYSLLNVNLNDLIGEIPVIGKDISYSRDELSLKVALDNSILDDNPFIDIDIPDYDNDVDTDTVFLYHHIETIEPDLVVGSRIKANTKIGESFGGTFQIQAQKLSTTIGEFRRSEDNQDSVDGTHDPLDDITDLGVLGGVVNLTYRSISPEFPEYTLEYPNIGVIMSGQSVMTPARANATILSIGFDEDFGNYVLIKFKMN